MLRYLLIPIILISSVASTRPVGAQVNLQVARKAVTAAQWAEGIKLSDYVLTDQDGVEFHLSEYFGKGKPLLLSYIYTHCEDVCPIITGTLVNTVRELRRELGNTFNVLTIGFDTMHDTPETLKAYGSRFFVDFGFVRYATADKETIDALTKEVGFFFQKTGHKFNHLNMVSVVDSGGTLYRQVYGWRIKPEDIREPVEELISGNITERGRPTVVDWIKQFCSTYDPISGTYVLNWAAIAGLVVQVIVIGTIVVVVFGGSIKSYLRKFFKS